VSNHAAEQPGFEPESLRPVKSPDHRRTGYRELRPLDDVALMKEPQVQNGDALAVLFDRYYNVVLSVALRILRDRAEAEDVLQGIFLEIFQKAGQFDPAKGSFFIWVMQYAYHRSINRKNYLIVRQFYANVPVEELTEFDHGVHKLYSQPPQECQRFVQEALALLTEGQKRTIEMVHFEGLTLKEVAEKTDESLPNVRHNYYRGLAKLKTHLESERHDESKGESKMQELGGKNAEA
jgi:RNA polymerase sigma-70 factor, ECF subfamily